MIQLPNQNIICNRTIYKTTIYPFLYLSWAKYILSCIWSWAIWRLLNGGQSFIVDESIPLSGQQFSI